ncbi:MAG: hypothetical protein GSR84_03095 [Desulfurococcales archaeon]|nr:hypothetical protein [Desulfurococcales archaeon]
MKLEELSPSEYRTLVLVYRYVYRDGRQSRCFTYQGLRSWVHYSLPKAERPEWHTIERAIRSLAERQVLKRIRRGRLVIFCPGQYWHRLLDQYRSQLRNTELPEASPYRQLLEYLDTG